MRVIEKTFMNPVPGIADGELFTCSMRRWLALRFANVSFETKSDAFVRANARMIAVG
jgi:hypothetical protein